jgi:hypothetical protein
MGPTCNRALIPSIGVTTIEIMAPEATAARHVSPMAGRSCPLILAISPTKLYCIPNKSELTNPVINSGVIMPAAPSVRGEHVRVCVCVRGRVRVRVGVRVCVGVREHVSVLVHVGVRACVRVRVIESKK